MIFIQCYYKISIFVLWSLKIYSFDVSFMPGTFIDKHTLFGTLDLALGPKPEILTIKNKIQLVIQMK